MQLPEYTLDGAARRRAAPTSRPSCSARRRCGGRSTRCGRGSTASSSTRRPPAARRRRRARPAGRRRPARRARRRRRRSRSSSGALGHVRRGAAARPRAERTAADEPTTGTATKPLRRACRCADGRAGAHAGVQPARLAAGADGLRLRDAADLRVDPARRAPARERRPRGAIWKLVLITPCSASCASTTTTSTTSRSSTHGASCSSRLLQASGAASLLLAALYLALPAADASATASSSPRSCFFVVAIVAWRLLFLQRRAVAAPAGARAHRRHRRRARARSRGRSSISTTSPYRVVGFIDDDPAMVGRSVVNPRVIGTPADIDAARARAPTCDRIVVGLSDRRGRLPIEELLAGEAVRACASRMPRRSTSGSPARSSSTT